MKLSRTSWHYRLNKWAWDKISYWHEPNNLCDYFWSTIVLPFLGVALLFVCAAILFVAMLWLFGPLSWGIYILFYDPVLAEITCKSADSAKDCVPEVKYFWSWFPYALFVIQSWLWWAAWRVFVVEKKLTPDTVISTFGLVKEGFISFKEGYCPLISFKDE